MMLSIDEPVAPQLPSRMPFCHTKNHGSSLIFRRHIGITFRLKHGGGQVDDLHFRIQLHNLPR